MDRRGTRPLDHHLSPRRLGGVSSTPGVHYVARTRYQNPVVAGNYDRRRFLGWRLQLKQRNQERVLARVLSALEDNALVLDLPTGTGRFLPLLEHSGKRWLGGDISGHMLREAAARAQGLEGGHGFARFDALALPFPDGAFDCVMSIRFIQHIPGEIRPGILGEFHRVSRRWLIIEYKLHNPVRALSKRLRGRRPDRVRDPADVRAELGAAGFTVRRVLPVSRLASTSRMYLCEKRADR